MNRILRFHHVLARDGILHDQQLELDAEGRILAIRPIPADASPERDGWLALPGMPNAHSHVFQRALSGFGETRSSNEDSFWSWREAMYRLAARVTPEDLHVIARQGFIEMLRSGFTSVAEFHYLHHLPDGSRSTAMADAVIAAANETGIRLRLLPVAYFNGGFGQAPHDGQRRFVHADIDEYLGLLEKLALSNTSAKLGIAPHSLRAVAPDQLRPLLDGAREILGKDFPVHIHIAEQLREVEECSEHFGARPVELLLDTVEPEACWQLVHATHVNDAELQRIRETGVGVVLCPITEAYLGDGLFPATRFVESGGLLAIGSDSNCRIDAFEELRWLEYGQRLRDRRRARLADAQGLQRLYSDAVAAGAGALGLPVAGIAEGQFADLVVFDENAPALLGHDADTAIDALIINGSPADPAAVYVGGEKRVEAGSHAEAAPTAAGFAATVRRLLG